MPIATRRAETEWNGSLAAGQGVIRAQSGTLDGLEVSWPARTERPDGKTSPEELAAAAHSSCFSQALALVLGERKRQPERLMVAATVTLDDVDGAPTVTASALEVRGQVPGTDAAEFEAAVAEAAQVCPISRLFAGAEISVEAQLDEN
jgi:lipoyl-dependent peroxiredoxin